MGVHAHCGRQGCSGAHYRARQFQAHGHTVRLMAPKLVTPYRISGKRGRNDAADAEPGHRLSRGQPVPGEEPGVPARRALQGAAICKAMQRPNMRFVPVKTEDQQARLIVHRARQGFVTARTACINRIRGLLSEFGIVLPLKAEVVRRGARNNLEDLPGFAKIGRAHV